MESSVEYERVRELMKRKKKLLAKLRRSKKEQVKARIEKRKINEELRSLSGKKNLFAGMDADKAASAVKKSIDDVKPGDIYPKDLEREFDKIDRPAVADQHKILDLGRVKERAAPAPKAYDEDSNSADAIVGDGEDVDESYLQDEVIDFSEQ
jgi:hypothetical protein